MNKIVEIKPEFVEYIPEIENMEQNVLYISKQFNSASHLCLCGCGKLTVTPFQTNGKSWDLLIEDNSIVSLHPSIGNHYFECKSHYWIKRNQGIID